MRTKHNAVYWRKVARDRGKRMMEICRIIEGVECRGNFITVNRKVNEEITESELMQIYRLAFDLAKDSDHGR